MSVYATFQTVEAEVEELYVGTAVDGNHPMSIWKRPLKRSVHHGIILAGYIVPFVVTILAILLLGIVIVVVLVYTAMSTSASSRRWMP